MNKIPKWDERGLLPPIFPGTSPTGIERSPYCVDIMTFIKHFATTDQRINLLDNFLKFRGMLFTCGIENGMQWINGSFCEHVEFTRKRHPNDIDVVTLFFLPEGYDNQEAFYNENKLLFAHELIKETFCIDSYFLVLKDTMVYEARHEIIYWNNLWSHTRDYQWKGFIEIPLDKTLDNDAQQWLKNCKEGRSNV